MAELRSGSDHGTITATEVTGGAIVKIGGQVVGALCNVNKCISLLRPISEARLKTLREHYDEYEIDTRYADSERARIVANAKAERVDERKGRGALASILRSFHRG